MTDLRQILTEQEAALAEADAAVEGGGRDPLEMSGVAALRVGCDVGDVAAALRRLVLLLPADPLDRRVIRDRVIAALRLAKIRGAAGWVDAALPQPIIGREPEPGQGHPVKSNDPEPSPEPVDGAALLDSLVHWFVRYLHLPDHAANAITLWAVATWFAAGTYFAPILAILSATKQCGKSLLLDLLRHAVRRPHLTSGTGVTVAVIFRLNETERPTFLIDEAEKLAGRHADRELIGMLNVGYRRGAMAQRCVEINGDFVVKEFDAFGFRALAAIGTLWDTIMDRSVVIRLERKPADASVARFSGRRVEEEGKVFVRQVRRWSDDCSEAFARTENTVSRPPWLSDRGCDNWTPLFAVAALAGGSWPARAEAASRALRGDGKDEGDRGERLVHDVRAIFEAHGQPEVIQSGDLATKLNEIETSPWGDERAGAGLSTHALAALLRRFGVGPQKARTSDGPQVRGYWLEDLEPVLRRYPAPAETVPSVPTAELSPATPPKAGTSEGGTVGTLQAGSSGMGTGTPSEGRAEGPLPTESQVMGTREVPDDLEVGPGVGRQYWVGHHMVEPARTKSGFKCTCPQRGACQHVQAVLKFRARQHEAPEGTERFVLLDERAVERVAIQAEGTGRGNGKREAGPGLEAIPAEYFAGLEPAP